MTVTPKQCYATLPAKLGQATGYQVAEAMDALTCIRIACCRVFPDGRPPEHFQTMIENLPTGKSTLASMRRTFAMWKKWTWQEMNLSTVQSFLFDSRNL